MTPPLEALALPASDPAGAPERAFANRDLILDAFEVFPERMFDVDINLHEGDASLDGHQDIVEIMSNTACQGSDGFHLLRLD